MLPDRLKKLSQHNNHYMTFKYKGTIGGINKIPTPYEENDIYTVYKMNDNGDYDLSVPPRNVIYRDGNWVDLEFVKEKPSFKDEVETYNDLPRTDNLIGDMYFVREDRAFYIWENPWVKKSLYEFEFEFIENGLIYIKDYDIAVHMSDIDMNFKSQEFDQALREAKKKTDDMMEREILKATITENLKNGGDMNVFC